jgi:hypothetical protein
MGLRVGGRRTLIGKLIVPVVVVLVLGVVVTMEFPEFLTLTDDTTNDFTIRKTVSVELLVPPLSGGHRQTSGIDLNIPEPELLSSLLIPVEKTALASSSLFILHSELRT